MSRQNYHAPSLKASSSSERGLLEEVLAGLHFRILRARSVAESPRDALIALLLCVQGVLASSDGLAGVSRFPLASNATCTLGDWVGSS
jgi:hypothetical protein